MTSESKPHSSVYTSLIGNPVERWYLRPLQGDRLSPEKLRSVQRQAVIGWLQTLLLLIVVVQSLFAGMLRALPPDVRASLGFLHRIEWGVYLGVLLIVAQVAAGWREQIVLTNRLYLLAWRF